MESAGFQKIECGFNGGGKKAFQDKELQFWSRRSHAG